MNLLSPEENLSEKSVQRVGEGEGPLYHRLYSVDFAAPSEGVKAAWTKLNSDVNAFSPQWLATFEKVKGDPHHLREGDEFKVKLSAPWQAPVRVTDVTDHSFSLVTLEGHLEAGKIHFRLLKKEHGFRFEIESTARSKDRIVDFLYDKIPLCRIAQAEMWECFCKNFASFARQGVSATGREPEVIIQTERRDEKTGQWQSI